MPDLGSVVANLLAALLAAALIAVGSYLLYRARGYFWPSYHKLTIFKVIRLRIRGLHPPYYQRHNRNVGGAPTDVFDETFGITTVVCSRHRHLPPLKGATSGSCDTYQTLPRVRLPQDANPLLHRQTTGHIIQEDRPVNVLGKAADNINGLQGEENWWFGVTVDIDRQHTVLVVDFSSIPNARRIVRNPKGLVVEPDQPPRPLGMEPVCDDVYRVQLPASEARAQSRIEFRFELDTDEFIDTGTAGEHSG